jgi:hypothetical protein
MKISPFLNDVGDATVDENKANTTNPHRISGYWGVENERLTREALGYGVMITFHTYGKNSIGKSRQEKVILTGQEFVWKLVNNSK